tara:strand:+ start:2911 stop:3264 length:354 start_codon:yes stop_codon:yes gene_type:complete
MQVAEDQKLVLVTGASRGIGKAIVQRLGTQPNYFILGTATSQANADTITAYMKASGISGCGHALNINHHDHIDLFMKQIQTSYGRMPDVLINNAGICQDNIILRMKPEQWNQVLHTN